MADPFNTAQQALIDWLKADANLTEATIVAEYIYGLPPIPVKATVDKPVICVDLAGGSYEQADDAADVLTMMFSVQIWGLGPESSETIKTVEDFAERVRSRLRSDPSLNGQVHTTRVVGFDLTRVPEERPPASTITFIFSWLVEILVVK